MRRGAVVGGMVLGLGLLLGAGCTRVRPHLSVPQIELGEPSFFPTLAAYASAPILGGNKASLLLNGDEIFPAMIDAIRSAQTTITYAQYFYEDGPVCRDIASALAERCRAGVQAKVLLDGFGTLSMPAEYTEMMKAAGCQVEVFRPVRPWSLHKANNRNHRRVLVVDGRVGFTGGSGVSLKWMGNGRRDGHWRDTDVRLEGPVVEQLQGAFVENWLEATGTVLGGEPYFPRLSPNGTMAVQVVKSSPAGGTFAIYTAFLLALSSAQRSIHITNPYFIPDERMATALLDARRRGVAVVVLVPGAIDHNLVRQASRAGFGPMLKAGVEIHEYRAGLLHSKTMVVDGVWASVGSTNLDNRSFALNDELNAFVYNREFGRRLEQVFAEDLEHSRRLTYEAWRRRPLKDRLFEMLAVPIRDLL